MKRRKNKAFRAVLFDADGTLYNSTPFHYEAWKRVCAEELNFEFTKEHHLSLHMRNLKFTDFIKEQGIKHGGIDLFDIKKKYYKELIKQMQPVTGVKLFLADLKKHNIPCAVVTGAYRETLRDSLEVMMLEDFFTLQITFDDTAGVSKPHPIPYQTAVKKLGLTPDDCVAFEDSNVGITSAHAAGIYCVGIETESYGRADVKSADHIIKDFTQLKYSIKSGRLQIEQ